MSQEASNVLMTQFILISIPCIPRSFLESHTSCFLLVSSFSRLRLYSMLYCAACNSQHFLGTRHLGFVQTQCFYFYTLLIMSLRSSMPLLCQKLKVVKRAQENWLVCVCVSVQQNVCSTVLQCVSAVLSLTKFTLSSKSAGW